MILISLTQAAKTILDDINALLPRARVQILKLPGPGRIYASDELYRTAFKLVSELVENIMYVNWEVCEYFQPTDIKITTGWMLVIPLTNGATVSPGGRLEKGFSVYSKDECEYAPDVPMVLVTPKPWAARFAKRKSVTEVPQPLLTSTAEKILSEIKALLPQASTVVNDRGEKGYTSEDLQGKLFALAKDIGMTKDWQYNIVEFYAPMRLANPRNLMRVISLFEDTVLIPGVDLLMYRMAFINGEPVMTANSPAVFLTRRL